MLRGFESDERIVKALRLPIRLRLAPVGGMTGDSVNEFVMSDILCALVGITTARAWGTNQSKPDRMVIRFI